LVEHLCAKKQQRVHCLVLSRGSHVALGRQMGEKCFYLGPAQFLRMTFLVEQDKALDPADIGLLRSVGKWFQAQGLTHAVEQFWFSGTATSCGMVPPSLYYPYSANCPSKDEYTDPDSIQYTKLG
jgi:hypothetical protein